MLQFLKLKGQQGGNLLPMVTKPSGHMKILPLPPLELLEYLFEVDETSPSGIRWKNPRAKRLKPGDVAGWRTSEGYWSVEIKTDKGRSYLCHRIIYYLLNKEDPGNYFVDHKSGRENNLDTRKATNSQNVAHAPKRSHFKNRPTSSKYKGVTWHKATSKWAAQIMANGKIHHLGLFKDEREAAKAYNSKALEFHGEFAYLNIIFE